MEFDTEWMTLGAHRVRLRSTKGFPTEAMRKAVEIVRIAVDNDMSARARLVEVVCRQEKIYEATIGTTVPKDKICAAATRNVYCGRARSAIGPHQPDRHDGGTVRGGSPLWRV